MKFASSRCLYFLPIFLLVFSLGCGEQADTKPKESGASVEKEKQPNKDIDNAHASKNSTATTPQTNPIPTVARKYGCLKCHAIGKKIIGPAWQDVAARYSNDPNATKRLFNSISKGSQGNWPEQVGNLAMPPHSYMKEKDITQLVTFILSLN